MSKVEDRVSPELIDIALEKAEGFTFERFSNDFLSSVEGRDFVPLGGVKDGGADAFSHQELYGTTKAGLFYQITVQKNHRDKIRKTIARLIEFGRAPKILYYVTSRLIQHIDKEEELLIEETGVNIKIRDKRYICSHINDSIGTISAFKHHLERYTDYLAGVGQKSAGAGGVADDPSIYVFLQHEVSNRLGDRKLIHSITDTLILWALRDTDPDKDRLMSRADIHGVILENFPWADSFIKAHLDQRLEKLRTKDTLGREIRWYRKKAKYCLPYETREIIKGENVQDEALRIECCDEVKLKAAEIYDGDDGEYELLSELVMKVIQQVFQRQGLLLSHFVSEGEEEDAPLIVADCIDEIVDQSGVPADKLLEYKDAISRLLNALFYDSSPTQRKYLHYLSRTYVLLFTLKAEPRVVDYFSNMGSNFRLFVGTDVLVKALSERYVKTEDQRCRNVLKAASDCGIKLCLSSCVLDELHAHIKSTHWEFVNHFAEIEPYMKRDIVRNCGKILIRAYFYAKERGDVKGWKTYIEQFVSYCNVTCGSGREELKKYLISEYNLTFYENDELEALVDVNKVDQLAGLLIERGEKENLTLARNSSLLVHGIYGLRRRDGEANNGSPFGYNTWWLTNQKKIQRHTYDLVQEKHAKYIMRPEFVLNFLAIAPSCEQVRKTYSNVFPSTLGIELGHRLSDDVFHKVLGRVKDWKDKDPGRINTLVSDLSDKLKSDQFKVYEETVETIEEKLNAIA